MNVFELVNVVIAVKQLPKVERNVQLLTTLVDRHKTTEWRYSKFPGVQGNHKVFGFALCF